MSSASSNAVPINSNELTEHLVRANSLLRTVKWFPKKPSNAPVESGALQWRENPVGAPRQVEEASVVKVAATISRDELIMSPGINQVLNWVRTGIQLGQHLSGLYIKTSNMEPLMTGNAKKTLTPPEQVEFREKINTASAIAVFATAYYIEWEMSKYRSEEVGNINLDFAGIPEISLKNPIEAAQCLIYYYAAYLNSGAVRTEQDFLKLTLLYFKSAVEEITNRVPSLKYTDVFTQRSYKLEGSEFDITGFVPEMADVVVSIEFNRVEIDKIVGNRSAKHHARRVAQRLVAFDPVTKRNPMRDLGGFVPISLGYGKPGTGKSMQIAATATIMYDLCQMIGLTFVFHPLPDSIVSTFQGGSAERMEAWFKLLADPTKIVYAPIDDAENNLEDRTRQGVSAGVREVIGVFLRYTEGAYAKNYGNSFIELCTNIAEQIDPAVMSRIVSRSLINGAETWEDFLDQDYLWQGRYREVDPKFIGMTDPKNYTYLSAQALMASLSEEYGSKVEPKQAVVKAIYEEALKKHDPNDQGFFAALFVEALKRFPAFSSRDVRNIQRAVDGRIMDFDFPEDWLSNPEIFYRKPYDDKHGMIKELMRSNMRGLSFAQIRLQEALRYLDNMVTIAQTGRNRKLTERIEEMKLHREAMEALNA